MKNAIQEMEDTKDVAYQQWLLPNNLKHIDFTKKLAEKLASSGTKLSKKQRKKF